MLESSIAKVVCVLESAGSGKRLGTVEIPADVEWEIGEYDGLEWVAEKHRTWD